MRSSIRQCESRCRVIGTAVAWEPPVDDQPMGDGGRGGRAPGDVLDNVQGIAGEIVRACREMAVLQSRLDPSWGLSMPFELALQGLSAALVSCDEIVLAASVKERTSSPFVCREEHDGVSWSGILHR